MKKFKKYKYMMITFCICYIVLSIAYGMINAQYLNDPIPAIDYLKIFIFPFIVIPLTIVLILTIFETVFAGIFVIGYIGYILSEDINILVHFDRALFFAIIPIVVALMYIYAYFKYKKNLLKKK